MVGLISLVSLASTILFAAYVFLPETSSPTFGQRGRFQLVDLFSLIFLWLYPLLFFQFVMSSDQGERRVGTSEIAVLIVFEIVVTAIWLGLVRSLSNRGVHRAAKRFVYVALAVPAGIIATLFVLASVAFLLTALSGRGPGPVEPALLLAASLLVGVVCRQAIDWALGRPDAPAPPPSGEDVYPD
jgi:hypothetical protein